jgi:hypothetical protein
LPRPLLDSSILDAHAGSGGHLSQDDRNYRGSQKNREKENDLVVTSRAERGIARHFLIDRLEACPTTLHHAPILIGYGHKTFENYYMCEGSAFGPSWAYAENFS